MRAQANTLEGIVAAGIVVASLVFALQVTAVTPLSASTASQHIENQQGASTTGLLKAAGEDGALRRAVLYYDESAGQFHGSGEADYYTKENDVRLTRLGELLYANLGEEGIAFNVNFVHYTSEGERRTTRFVYRGEPSDNSISSSRTVTIYEDDYLVESDRTTDTSATVSSTDFYIEKATGSASGLYNVVEVEVVVWRM